MKKKILYSIIGLVFFVGIGVLCYPRQAEIVVSPTSTGFIRPYAEKLCNEVNKKLSGSLGKKYTLYTANFEKGKPFPNVSKDSGHKILWLGSTRNYIPDLSDFDIVLASTPILNNFIKGDNEHTFYLPVFTDVLDIKAKKGEFIAIIGEPPFIEEVLKDKDLPYFKYTLEQDSLILEDMSKFQAVFVEGSSINNTSIDVHPIIYTLAAQKIPLVTYWAWPDKEEAFNLFNNDINFYLDKEDAARFVDTLLNKSSSVINQRAQNARRLVKHEYSLKSAVNRLLYIIQNDKDLPEEVPQNSLNFDIPVAVGHTGSGDFWLATDLASYFETKGYHTNFTYFNSLYKYKTEVNILVRGYFADISDMCGELNIYYLAYPQLGDEVAQEVIDNKEAYYDKLTLELNKYDAVAVASESVADALTKKGIKAHYIPQFTNTKRFYPDYQEELKSEVLFVGINAPYRRAAKIAYENKLPISIYGPHWGDMSKGEYVDNNILRKYYSSAKIVLNDTRREMLVHGVISNRIFDASACGTLVISDYMPEIEAIYGDSVPMWKTEQELVSLIKYYLDPKNEAERIEKAKQAQEITLKNFTHKQTAQKFLDIINELKEAK